MKISVCIPAYKNAAFLKRNLDALVDQTFKGFEVVISDDSPDESVAEIAEAYRDRLQILYLKNEPAKGTPANWNYAMQHATGQYIKLMHDDDWFATGTALQQYYDCLEAHPSVDFCFSAFYNVHINSGKMDPVFCSSFNRFLLKLDRYNLFKRNFIGPPSVVFQRNTGELYDERFKWLVDFEGYIRFLNIKNKFIYLDKNLVNIGLSGEQVTSTAQHDKSVVIPESLYFIQKHGSQILQNIFVYDYYWRMCRNFSIHKKEDFGAAGWKEELPGQLEKMLSFQQKLPKAMLHVGPLSKLWMLLSYVKHR